MFSWLPAGLSEIGLDLLAAVVALLVSALLARVYRFLGVKIEDKHAHALHEAVLSWAENATRHGVRRVTGTGQESLQRYLAQSVPDALAALRPSSDVLATLAGRYLNNAVGPLEEYESRPPPPPN